MSSVTIQQAQAGLAELIHRLAPGEEVVILENDQPVARLLPTAAAPARKPRALGTMRGTVLHVVADFDAGLEEFREYME